MGREVDWEFGIDMDTLLCLKYRTKKKKKENIGPTI